MMKTFLSIAVLLFAVAQAPARADDSIPNPAPSAAPGTDSQNNRMKTLEGSRSRWSGQFNLGYSGSSLTHPFSEFAPNPRGEVPPPVVTMSGTVSARYRIDKSTTMGLGTGVLTETPFQGPKNTTFSEPYVDVARSFKLGFLHNRADVSVNMYTSSAYYDSGYRWGLSVSNETYHEFDFGLTAGFVLGVDYNLFGGDYDPSGQMVYDLVTDPYFEYSLTKKLNLRSVIGIAHQHTADMTGAFNLHTLKIYQTFGLGISALDSLFLYAYARVLPFADNGRSMDTTTVGFSAIFNLF